MTTDNHTHVTREYLKDSPRFNERLAFKLLNLTEQEITKQTHFFDGRYENIYVDKDTIPDLATLVENAKQYAAKILNRDEDELKIGFWINIMQQGHTTTLHRHDDSDELLSCVYYVKVPENSGQFVYHVDNEKRAIDPEEGMFLFFSPSLLHEVTEQKSNETRISIAFNIGPIKPEEYD